MMLLKWDIKLFNLINDNLKTPFLDKIMPYFTNIGGAMATFCILVIFSFLIVQFLKQHISRIRPYEALPDVNFDHNFALSDYSFPSGHSATIFCMATMASWGVPWLAPVFFGIASLVAVSRIYLGLHFPSDVMAGSVIGWLCAAMVLQ